MNRRSDRLARLTRGTSPTPGAIAPFVARTNRDRPRYWPSGTHQRRTGGLAS